MIKIDKLFPELVFPCNADNTETSLFLSYTKNADLQSVSIE